LIACILFLAAGLGLIFVYCNGASSFNAAFPVSASVFHLDVTTAGPAALGGIALIATGILLLLWALLGAIVGQISLMFRRNKDDDRILTSERIFE